MPDPSPILVAGAGIGGLAAGLALARKGRPTVLVERAEELAEVGAGLQLSPNATRVLARFGLIEALRAVAVEPRSIDVHSVGAGLLVSMPVAGAVEKRHGSPYLVVHRGDLQAILAAAARAEPSIDLRLGHHVTDVVEEPGGFRLEARGPGGPVSIAGDALVGADGVRSRTRMTVLDGAGARFTGRIAYRATLPADETPPEVHGRVGMWMAEKSHVVHYPVRAGREINVVAVVQDGWTGEGWSEPVERAEVVSRFETFPEPVRSLLMAPKAWLKWALCGIDPDFAWTRGRLTLLGDACHPMLPFLAQGAAMAIEDAAVLAAEVAKPQAIERAFAAYEAARRPRTSRVVREARENGRIYHLGGAVAFARDMGLRLLGPNRLAERYDWLWGWRPPE